MLFSLFISLNALHKMTQAKNVNTGVQVGFIHKTRNTVYLLVSLSILWCEKIRRSDYPLAYMPIIKNLYLPAPVWICNSGNPYTFFSADHKAVGIFHIK